MMPKVGIVPLEKKDLKTHLNKLSSVAGITLFHPQLPEPSTNYTLVYLDISTLEPQNGFTEIRQSMIRYKYAFHNVIPYLLPLQWALRL